MRVRRGVRGRKTANQRFNMTTKALLFFCCTCLGTFTQATPSWEELDSRPLPAWYDEAKFGIFIHWGVFSVPAYKSEWFWSYWKSKSPNAIEEFVNATERPGFTYQEYASRFTAELYKPDQWTDAFANSGAQYVVLTSKHHEGYCK